MIKEIGDFLNKVTTKLFINAKAKARLRKISADGIHLERVSNAKAIYEKQIKGYFFGLGFLLSFIEGTDAYKAREELYNTLMVMEDGVFEFFEPIFDGLNRVMNSPSSVMLHRDVLRETFFADGKTSDFVHPLNIFQYPLPFLASLLGKVQHIILTIPLIILLIPFFALAFVTELALMLVDTILFDPIRFVCEEVNQYTDSRDKVVLYVPVEEYKGVSRIFDAFEGEKREVVRQLETKRRVQGFLTYPEKKKLRDNQPEYETFKPIFATENALALVSPGKKDQCDTYANSLFFKMYKQERLANRGQPNAKLNTSLHRLLFWMDNLGNQRKLSKEENKAIVTIYNTLESMWHCYTHQSLDNKLLMDLTMLIINLWMEISMNFGNVEEDFSDEESYSLSM